MRRQPTCMILLLVLCVLGAIPLILLTPARTSTTTTSEGISAVQPLQSITPLTVGVILTNRAAQFGWGGLVADNVDFGRAQIGDHTAILYDRLNTTDRPGITLDWVVDAMIGRGARTIFVSEGSFARSNQAALDELYPNTVFVMNLATRADVEALLPALAFSAPGQQGQPAIEQPVQTADTSATSPAIVRGLIAVIIFALILLALTISIARSWNRPGRGSHRRVIEHLMARVAALDRPSKPKKKRGPASGVHGRGIAIEHAARHAATDFAAMGEPEPVIHRFSTYVNGDPHFEESFPVELAPGTFLGEVGVGIAAPVNKYDPGRVAALDVWMFDKNDGTTVNVLLGSEHALRDSALKRALYKKGSTLLPADEDTTTELETTGLRLRARVLSMSYGFSDTLPQRSFFDYVVVELAVWQK